MNSIIEALTIATVLGAALMSGTFFAFSAFVMPALNRLEPQHAIEAMKSINIKVINPLFLTAFIGTALTCLAIAAFSLTQEMPMQDRMMLIAVEVLYLGATVLLTVKGNVPLNNALAKADPHPEDAKSIWDSYQRPWTRLNHIRTIAPLGAVLLLFLISHS